MGRIDPTTSADVTVRTIRPDEGERLKTLRLEAITSCPTAFGADVEITLAKDWNERAAASDGTKGEAIFVAEHDDRLVGMTGVYRHTTAKTRHACGIWGVFVQPAFRGRGVGEALIDAAVDWAAQQDGVTIIRLMVTVGNEAALACYRRCGFEITGKESATIRVDGVEYDEYLLCRRLKAP
ncbi:MAG: GNAT family N-acetyltransferase [Tepidisphaeraceae bacterium]